MNISSAVHDHAAGSGAAGRRGTAAVLLVLLLACPAAASELDGLAFLSWSPDAVVDTLDVAGPGSHDLWLLVLGDQAPAGFIETVGDWDFGPGLVITDFAVLTTGNPVGAIELGDRGHVVVRIGDFDCRRGDEPDAVARLTLQIDPAHFVGPGAGIKPSPTATRLAFADYDPILHCVGVWDMAVIGPASVRAAALPTIRTSLGAWKARYR